MSRTVPVVICFILFLLLNAYSLFLNTPSAYAQEASASASSPSSSTQSPNGLEKPTAEKWDGGKQMVYFGEGVINLVTCWTIAVPYNTDGCPVTVIGEKKNETRVAYNGEGGGLLGSGTRFISMMYATPPASGTQYLARAIDSQFGLVPQSAYAQVTGSGAAVIQPVEALWKLSRNIAYILYIFIFLAVGFMIMFRQKLNPQTVITVQNALPGLVVGLILVTFSYFIAGLIVDMAFVLSQFAGVLLLSQINKGDTAFVRDILDNQSIITLFWSYIMNYDNVTNSANIGSVIYETIDSSSFGYIFHAIVGVALCFNPLSSAAIEAGASLLPVSGGVQTAIGFGGKAACSIAVGTGASPNGLGNTIINGVILVILIIAMMIALARLFFSLISSYIMIMVLTIFGPIMILFSSVPGNGGSFSSWWRQLLANTLVFPAVFGLFMLVTVILNLNSPNTYGAALPLLGGFPATFMQLLLAYGLLLASPAVPGFVLGLLKAKNDTVFGKQIAGNVKLASTGASIVGGFASTGLYKFAGGFLEASPRLSGNKYLRKFSTNLANSKGANLRDPGAQKPK